jgi:hypothetical protein
MKLQQTPQIQFEFIIFYFQMNSERLPNGKLRVIPFNGDRTQFYEQYLRDRYTFDQFLEICNKSMYKGGVPESRTNYLAIEFERLQLFNNHK